MPSDKVNYDDYRYRGYVWHEEGRESLPRRSKKPEKPVKDRRRGFDARGAFAVITIALCFIITFLIAHFVGGGSVLGFLPDGSKSADEAYYAVAADSYDSEELSAISADELRKLGGGGFVIHDGRYYLIAGVYGDEASAKKVAERMESLKATVYKIEITKPQLKWCKTADKSTVEEVLTYAEKIYRRLYEISVDLDSGNIAEAQAASKIGILQRDINKLTSKLNGITVSEKDFNLIKLKAETAAADAMLDNLKNQSLPRYNLVSDIRYTYTAIIVGYKNLTRNI